ncbi:MAG TPA: kelch repeat-containing protein [Terriglobales bacterium]|nr:kelch repeat-containing protein [Terriglobales bacterium]
MIPSKQSKLALIGCVALLLAACSGLKTTSGGGGGGGGGGTTTYAIGGTVTGLVGTGLVLTDNTTDTLTITPGTGGAVPFTFTTKVSGAYDVEVKTQPANPTQTCTATSNKGTATADVTTVAITCTTNPVTATIGGTITGLQGSGLILQDNGGDSLTITGTGSVNFTFKTPVTGPTDAYNVTVLTQPSNPLQICTVANGTGFASANVTNVAITCVLAYTIGGNVNGVVGTGLILQNTGAEQLTISPGAGGNSAFTFVNPVPTGFAYTVTIFQEPTNPAQNCVVAPGTGSGTATANVTNVTINCPAVTYSVGGTVVGLAGVPSNNGVLTDNSFSLQNNLGDTKIITENGPFTFATPEALNGQYNISVFTNPSTQSEGCTTWNYKGVVTGNITSVVVDCAHDDWTWIDGTKTSGTIAQPQYGAFPTSAPTTIPNPFTNTPGARYGAAGWRDSNGNLWLFGGDGWELVGKSTPDTLNAVMNDLWVCVMTFDYCQWQLVGGYNTTYGAAIIANAQNEYQFGVYSNVGNVLPFPTPVPGGRWGAASWTDTSGNLWMFGGNGNSSGSNGLLNDLWKFDTSSFTTANSFTNNTGQWTWVGGSNLANTKGTYSGTPFPGARVSPVTWTDNAGNFWLFGGYGFDGSGNEGFLNDLWEYTPGSNTWAYVSGSNLTNQKGTYGTQGTGSTNNIPGGRQEAVGWYDQVGGNLWVFGGEGYDSAGTATGILNDLWVYNIASKQWTYVMGSSTANQTGTYELQPVVGPTNTTGAAGTCGLAVGSTIPPCPAVSTTGAVPGSRWGASAWTDAAGNFWLFGGWGLDSTGTNGNGALNDTWVYTPNATAGQPGIWSWVKGSNTGNQNGVYGDMLRPYKTYVIWNPGGRSNATHWIDDYGQFWLFGGEGYDSTSTTGNGYLNDMWRYLPYQD